MSEIRNGNDVVDYVGVLVCVCTDNVNCVVFDVFHNLARSFSSCGNVSFGESNVVMVTLPNGRVTISG